MENEKRNIENNEIIDIFKQTKRTSEFEILNIEYVHHDLYPDGYIVTTDHGKYWFQMTVKYNWKGNRDYNLYPRIVKMSTK